MLDKTWIIFSPNWAIVHVIFRRFMYRDMDKFLLAKCHIILASIYQRSFCCSHQRWTHERNDLASNSEFLTFIELWMLPDLWYVKFSCRNRAGFRVCQPVDFKTCIRKNDGWLEYQVVNCLFTTGPNFSLCVSSFISWVLYWIH